MNARVLAAGLLVALPLLAILVLNLGRDPHAVASPLVGRAAPPFTLSPAGGGAQVALASLRGKPLVLNFWATWCVPCLEEHDVLTQAAEALGSDVQFLGVVYEDDEQRVLSFLDQKGKAYPSLLDPEARTAIAYGVFGVPETYFIGRDGTIAGKVVGPVTAESLAENLRKASRSTP